MGQSPPQVPKVSFSTLVQIGLKVFFYSSKTGNVQQFELVCQFAFQSDLKEALSGFLTILANFIENFEQVQNNLG